MIFNNLFNKILFIIALLYLSSSCASSNIASKSIIDINGHVIIDKVSNKTVSYVLENGAHINAYYQKGIEFNGGHDSLEKLLNKVYYNNPDYNKYPEFNNLENFIILFDTNLNIKEVRILSRQPVDSTKYYYESLFIEALKNTYGMWHTDVKRKDWYIYLHRQKIY